MANDYADKHASTHRDNYMWEESFGDEKGQFRKTEPQTSENTNSFNSAAILQSILKNAPASQQPAPDYYAAKDEEKAMYSPPSAPQASAGTESHQAYDPRPASVTVQSLLQLAEEAEKQARLTAVSADTANNLAQSLIEDLHKGGDESLRQLTGTAVKNAFLTAEAAVQAQISAMETHAAAVNQSLADLENAKDSLHLHSQDFINLSKQASQAQEEADMAREKANRIRLEYAAKQNAALSSRDALAQSKREYEAKLSQARYAQENLELVQKKARNAQKDYLQLKDNLDDCRNQWQRLQQNGYIPKTPDMQLPPPSKQTANINIPADMTARKPADMPAKTPLDLPAKIAADIPAAMPVNMPVNMQADITAKIPLDIPEKIPVDLPAKIPFDILAKLPVNIPLADNDPLAERQQLAALIVPQPEAPTAFGGAFTQSALPQKERLPKKLPLPHKLPLPKIAALPKAESAPKKVHLWTYGKLLMAVVVLMAFLRLFVLDVVMVDGVSMQPTLQNFNSLISFKMAYRFSEPQRFDIILMDAPDESGYYIKRIIGLPNERIRIENGQVFIDDELLAEDFLDVEFTDGTVNATIPEGHYFVMGDNRPYSRDSRIDSIGAIAREHISAKAILRIFPLSELMVL